MYFVTNAFEVWTVPQFRVSYAAKSYGPIMFLGIAEDALSRERLIATLRRKRLRDDLKALGIGNLGPAMESISDLNQAAKDLDSQLAKAEQAEAELIKAIRASSKKDVYPIHLWDVRMHGQKALPIEEFNSSLEELHRRLYVAMLHYHGLGIAAPQIGIPMRAAVIEYQDRHLFMINPELIEGEGHSTEWEACLSLPGHTSHGARIHNRAKVTRCREVQVLYYDKHKAPHREIFTGYLAHAVQHEIDHLDGIFFIDRCGDLSRRIVLDKFRNSLRLLKKT